MRLLYQVKLLDRTRYNDREIGQILSLNPYRLKYVRQDGRIMISRTFKEN